MQRPEGREKKREKATSRRKKKEKEKKEVTSKRKERKEKKKVKKSNVRTKPMCKCTRSFLCIKQPHFLPSIFSPFWEETFWCA